jgi:hypothetical protein
VEDLGSRVAASGMHAVAVTDHGNMFGAITVVGGSTSAFRRAPSPELASTATCTYTGTYTRMAQVTLYLDKKTQARMKAAAKAAGLSQSRWLAEMIHGKTSTDWSAEVAALAGAWADAPTVQTLRRAQGRDVRRERL